MAVSRRRAVAVLWYSRAHCRLFPHKRDTPFNQISETHMSIMVVDRQMVHYEVFGHGRPVIFLHGWLGSWRYWFPTMERVAENFRTYSFDFWGFGESRRKSTYESIQNYSDQVIRFLDE